MLNELMRRSSTSGSTTYEKAGAAEANDIMIGS